MGKYKQMVLQSRGNGGLAGHLFQKVKCNNYRESFLGFLKLTFGFVQICVTGTFLKLTEYSVAIPRVNTSITFSFRLVRS